MGGDFTQVSENASERDALVDESRSESVMSLNEGHFTSAILRLTGCERSMLFIEACETQREPAALHSDARRAFGTSLSIFSSSATVH